MAAAEVGRWPDGFRYQRLVAENAVVLTPPVPTLGAEVLSRNDKETESHHDYKVYLEVLSMTASV